MTAREFLGDDNIRKLEGLGFSPLAIRDLAKKEYETKKQSLIDRGINEGVAAQGAYENMSDHEIEQMNDDASRGWIRRGWDDTKKAVLETANAYSKFNDYGKDIENYLNKKISGDEKAKFERKTKSGLSEYADKEIKRIDKADERWAQAHPDEWNVAGAAGGLVGGFIDPINFIPLSSSAKWGKKILYYAGTGAVAGGVSAYGGDRNVGEGAAAGAIGGAFLGPLMEYGINGISKLIAKRRANRAANEADAIEHAENSEFIGGGDVRSGGDNTGSLEPTSPQSVALTVVRSVLKNEPLLTREQVLKEILSGAEKSSVIKPEKYKSILNSINEYKSYQNTLRHVHDNPDEVKNADLIFGQMQDKFIRANKDNTKKYYDAAPLFGRELKTAQTMTAREFATGEAGLDEATAAKVIKEAAQGKEKSDFTDEETYADIVKFKNFENQRDYARAYGEQIEAAKQSLKSAREQSAVRYADIQKAINEYQKQGMSASATRELINAKFKPGADEINYTRAYNGGADVDPRLAGQGIFYAIEKDIAAYKYTPEQYFALLKSKGCGDEQATIFTQAYAKKDINIAKDWANGKAAEVYENNVRAQVASKIKAKNEAEGEGWTMKDGGEAKQYAEHKFEPEKWINDLSGVLSDEWAANLKSLALKHPEMFKSEADVFRVIKEIKDDPTHFFKNNRDDAALIAKELKDEKAGNIVIKKDDGRIVHVNKTRKSDIARLQRNNEKALEGTPTPSILDAEINPAQTRRFAATPNDEIILQKGNLVNEKEANGLRDSVSSIGDNASRTGGRQTSDEQILRQGGPDTPGDGEAKRRTSSDEQMEQRLAAKADGEADAAAAGEQVVEKQASGASIGGGVAANSNAHLGSGLVAGTLNSQDEDGNFSPERFAAGFLAGLAGGKAVATGLRKMTPKLYNKILGAAEKMPQMANGNPRLLGKLYSNGKDVSLNSFAGEKAITANVGKLDQAKAMLEKGANEVEIWQKTGWFKDKDGAWKFEIGDGNARLNPGFQSGGRLGELLDHEGLFKAYPELKDVTVVKIGDETPGGAALSVKDAAQREKRGIYNVAYNDKTATLVRQDLQKIDDALILEKGSNKKGGAVHIKKHLDPGAQGAITQGEFLSVGKNIREYLQKYKKPFIDESGGRIYEWADGNGVKFRVVVYEKADGISASHPNSIISFYSNRNLKKPMEFRNPQVKYDVNLSEWHKDSASITKNTDGSPKTFYHGSNEGGLDIFKRQPEGSGYGFWFTVSQKQANEYASAELIPGYLKITKPFEIEKINDYDTLKNIFGLSEKAFKEFQSERQIWRKAMEKLRAREFRIADKDHLGFMLYDKNGDYVQTPNQMLVHDVHTLRDADNDELAHFVYDKYYDRYVTGEVDVLAAVLNKNDYDVGKNFLRNKLKKAGYDGIKIDDNVIVVFDSAQIKHVKNNGNFSDSPNIYKSGAEGYYDPARNEIGLSDLGDKSTLMHEVQHVIQEIEDFARGGNRGKIEGLLWYESGRLAYNLKKLTPPPEFYVLEKKRTALSSKLFQAQDKVIEQNPLMEDNIIDNIVDKKSIDELNLKNTKELNELKGVLAEYRDTNNALDDMLKNHPIFKERKKISDKLDALVKKDPYEEYKKLLGEVEARNVQNRLNLDGKAHPHETFDVNPHETIVSKEDGINYSRKIEEIKREHPNVEKELDESMAAMRKESFNDSNFKEGLMGKFDTKEITTQELGKSVNLSDKQLAVLKNDIKNADFKVISDSKIYFDKIGKDGDKKRFFVDIAEDGSLRVDAYAKSQIDNIPVKQSALEELAGTGDAARLKNMSFEVKAAYRNELDPIKKEAILKTAELNKLKKAAQSGDKAAVAKFEEFKAKNLDENGNIKDGLSLC